MNTLLSLAVLGFMATRLVTGLRIARTGSGRALVRSILRRLGWRHLWPVPFVLATVITLAWLLTSIPGLDWGWWSAIGGEGSPVFGSSEATSGGPLEWIIPIAFMAMLVPALPLFAHAEERLFRKGAEQWSPMRRTVKTLQFGMVHALIGIPIGAAIALSAGGAYFMRVYLQSYRASGSSASATVESATAHTAYNGVIIGIVFIAFALLAVGL